MITWTLPSQVTPQESCLCLLIVQCDLITTEQLSEMGKNQLKEFSSKLSKLQKDMNYLQQLLTNNIIKNVLVGKIKKGAKFNQK